MKNPFSSWRGQRPDPDAPKPVFTGATANGSFGITAYSDGTYTSMDPDNRSGLWCVIDGGRLIGHMGQIIATGVGGA